MVGFADGSLVELFEFVDPAHPVEVIAPERREIQFRGTSDELAAEQRRSAAPAAHRGDDAACEVFEFAGTMNH